MYKVLIADDKEVFRRKIKRLPYFQQNSNKFRVEHEAQNGLEVLEILRSNQVDVVLTDIRMPFIGGIELLKRIKEDGFDGCAILLSEYASFDYAKAGILNGAFDYILKPIDDSKIGAAFDRAYSYLSAAKRLPFLNDTVIEELAAFIASGDPAHAAAYASRITKDLLFHSARVSSQVVFFHHALKQLRQCLSEKHPWASLYIPFDELCRPVDTQSPTHSFIERVKSWAEAFDMLCVRSQSESVQKACQYILEHSGEELHLQTLADELYLNKNYLGMLFKKELGIGFVDYLTAIRVKRAQILLRQQDLKIFEIASMLGYPDACYFSKVFKKVTGEHPCAYREKVHQ